MYINRRPFDCLLECSSFFRPQYVAPLREEIEETVGRLGWTKDAIGQMPKLESFMKECMRINPPGAGE
jgi:hypothetical protein